MTAEAELEKTTQVPPLPSGIKQPLCKKSEATWRGSHLQFRGAPPAGPAGSSHCAPPAQRSLEMTPPQLASDGNDSADPQQDPVSGSQALPKLLTHRTLSKMKWPLFHMTRFWRIC